MPSWLLTTATAEEARAAAALDWAQWARFYAFAKEEARRLAHEHPEWNWTNVPASEKNRVRDSINSQLAREGIPMLGEDIIRWRMSICIRDVKQWAVNKTVVSKRSPPATASSGFPIAPSRPYDPIRDI